jgi:cellulose synthase operon protein C
LLRLGAQQEALPFLENLAESDPQRWLGAFSEAAQLSGQRDRLSALWKRLAGAQTSSSELRFQLAFRLLESGDKPSAERIFRGLAQDAGPGEPFTRQLLFVWGPRPNPEQLDWLELRANASVGVTKGAWLRHLLERGGAARVVRVARKADRLGDDGSVALAYLDAAEVSGDRPLVLSVLQERSIQTSMPTELVLLARYAARLGDDQIQRQIISAAISSGGEEPELQKSLGVICYRMKDWQAAEQALIAFHLQMQGDQDTHRMLGELRERRRDLSGAQQAYVTALQILERSGAETPSKLVTRASLLHRLGRSESARMEYEKLLAQRPNDDNIRADYASMLMTQGDARFADTVLSERTR